MARVLVTRPMPAAARSAARIEALGHRVLVAPLLVFRPLPLAPDALPAPDEVDALVVTSARSLEALAGTGMTDTGMAGAGQLAPYLRLPVFAVGTATGQAAREAGFGRVAEAGGTLSDLVRLIAERRPGERLLYLAGRERSGDLAGELAPRGFQCRLVETYAIERLDGLPPAVRAALAAEDEGRPVLAPVYSRRSALALAGALGSWTGRPDFRFLAISGQAGEPLQGLGPVVVAARCDEDALLDLLPTGIR